MNKDSELISSWLSDVRREFLESGSIQADFRAKLDMGEYLPFSHEVNWPYPLAPRIIPKKVWIFWSQGWCEAPGIVEICRQSWISKNRDWEVISLDASSVGDYISLENLIAGKTMGHAAFSDILRLHLLEKYGGVWVDATTFCAKPISDWLPFVMQSGFFAFSRPRPDRLVASWFLASEPNGVIVRSWLDLTQRYWREVDAADHYFWCHYLFAYGVRHDPIFGAGWAVTPQVSAYACLQAQPMSRPTQPREDVIAGLKAGCVPVYKLNHHLSVPLKGDDTPLAAILSSIEDI